MIKTILALVNDPGAGARSPTASPPKSATRKNAELARVVGGDEVQLVLADDLIARIVVHSLAPVRALSAVYSELLDFDGCEIYTLEQPALDRQHASATR